MILHNPTKEEVSVTILGTDYSILPEKEIELVDNVAKAWLKIHGFLRVITKEVKEEVKEEKPVTKTKK